MSNALLAYRKKKDLTQQEVADQLGVSRAMVAALESGVRNFTAEMAVNIERKLGIDRVLIRPDIFRRRAVA
jgi:transcriptional regulator with XRE-family HTH domain